MGLPIGNPDDVTLRALTVLRQATLILAEDPAILSRLFKKWEIPWVKDSVVAFNEHTRAADLPDILKEIRESDSTVLVSDAGMPVFCDPGADLVELVEKAGIPIDVIPGPTALMTAAVRCGIKEEFFFAGFPPRKKEERPGFFQRLNRMNSTVILYETPYRSERLMSDLSEHLLGDKKVIVCSNLTLPDESIVRCDASKAKSVRIPEGPFVVIIHASNAH